MIDEIRQFVLDSLTDMNYSIDDIDDDTVLGPAGADLESLALAELAVRVEDQFGGEVRRRRGRDARRHDRRRVLPHRPAADPARVGALTVPGAPQRSDVVAMLATYGDRQPEQVPEAIDSLELAWLIHQIEQRYGALDVDDDMLDPHVDRHRRGRRAEGSEGRVIA